MASKNIKGITVEIGGDTSNLGKALDNVNKKTKDLQSELRGVNTLLKMDPGNVTLLTQKQDLLSASIANTKEKLDTLTEAQAQVQAQFEKGEITEEQYRDFQREIVNTEQKLESLTDELKEFGSVGAQQVAQVGDKMQEVGGKVEEAGQKLSVVSAGTGAVLAGAMASFVELDSGYDTIITKTGATGEALEDLNHVADNIFGNMPTDMDTVGTAVGEVNTRFGLTGKNLELLSEQFIKFAEINGVDLNNSIGTVDKIIEQFNLDASETGDILNIVTAKAQQTGISADSLLKIIQDNGATFKDMGLGVAESVELLAQFEANGVNVETAVKGLKKATTEYTEQGLSMDEALGKTIEKIKNASSETQALAIAQEIFGTKGANEMAKAIREGRISVDDLSASMSDYAGVVSDTYAGTLDPIDQGTVAMNNLKLAGSELAGSLQETFAPMLTTLVDKLKDLVAWFTDLSPSMQKTIVIVLSVVTALGPLVMIIGNLITSVGTILSFAPKVVTAFNGIKTAFSALSTVLMANPIAVVIVAVTALVAGFIYLWNTCDEFRQFWIDLWETIKTALGKFGEWLNTKCTEIGEYFSSLHKKINETWESVKTNAKEAWDSLVRDVSHAWTSIKELVATWGEYFASVWENIKTTFSSVKTWFTDVFKSAWLSVQNVFSNWGAFFSGLWSRITSTFSNIGTNIANAIGGAVRNALNRVISMIENTINSGIGLINGAIGAINQIPGVSLGSIGYVSLPRLAKGGIVNRPTIAEIGEDGQEAIIPLEKNTGWLRGVARELNDHLTNSPGLTNTEVLEKLDGIYDRLGRIKMVTETGALVGEIIDQVDSELGYIQGLRARGV